MRGRKTALSASFVTHYSKRTVSVEICLMTLLICEIVFLALMAKQISKMRVNYISAHDWPFKGGKLYHEKNF